MLLNYKPSKEIFALPDFISFAELKSKMYNTEIKNLLENKLNEAKRLCFYPIGFGEGILLDNSNKWWRKEYLTNKFYIEHYFKNTKAN